MGMSLEEYLEGRKACDHCESTGNQNFCTTNLLSREDSCIFFNALTKNGDPHDDADVLLLQKFRSTNTEKTVLDYYIRASKIVSELNALPGDNTDLWMDITIKYVRPILTEIRENRNEEALVKIFSMLDGLEGE